MATLKDMVDEVRSNLAGYTMRQDRITYVATELTPTDLTIQLGNSNSLAKGIVEIDDELILVDSFDKSTGVLSVMPGFGRGYLNTTPSPHPINSQITLAPTFPRVNIKQAINDTINAVFPKLWAVSSTTITFNTVQNTYALPDDCQDVLSVSWHTTGPTKEWVPVREWRMNSMANRAYFNSTSTITIYDRIEAGRTVEIWYTTIPNTLGSNGDDFADVTGLPESTRDVITLGASARLLTYLDSGRINLTSAEADAADSKIPSQAGSNAAKYVYALYQTRLKEESSKLQGQFPVKIHYTRR